MGGGGMGKEGKEGGGTGREGKGERVGDWWWVCGRGARGGGEDDKQCTAPSPNHPTAQTSTPLPKPTTPPTQHTPHTSPNPNNAPLLCLLKRHQLNLKDDRGIGRHRHAQSTRRAALLAKPIHACARWQQGEGREAVTPSGLVSEGRSPPPTPPGGRGWGWGVELGGGSMAPIRPGCCHLPPSADAWPCQGMRRQYEGRVHVLG